MLKHHDLVPDQETTRGLNAALGATPAQQKPLELVSSIKEGVQGHRVAHGTSRRSEKQPEMMLK